jgi:hypothetical protein
MGTRNTGILSNCSADHILQPSLPFFYMSFTVILLPSPDLRHLILYYAAALEKTYFQQSLSHFYDRKSENKVPYFIATK